MENVLLLNETQLAELKDYLSKKEHKVSLDFSLSEKQIKEIGENRIEAWNKITDEIDEINYSYLADAKETFVKSEIEHWLFKNKITLSNEIDEDMDIDEDELIDKLIEEYDLKDFPSVYFDFDSLLDVDVPVRLVLYSNYDCINSFHTESDGYRIITIEDSYLGDVIKRLSINPQDIKNLGKEKELKPVGKFGKTKFNDSIDIKEFWTELENTGSACLFCFAGEMPLKYFLNEENKKPQKVKVLKNTQYGFFGSWQGCGSPFDATLKNDIVLEINKHLDTEYDEWRILLDGEDGYSMDDVYGLSPSFYRIGGFEIIETSQK